tara:strand:- start:3506 stop:5743 length:2238 start_codon:yes stop_codon:yes gene_type:complete
MSNLSDLLPAGGGAKVITATASGNLATGQTVALQSDGTVIAISSTAAGVGSEVVFESADTQEIGITYDTTNDKVVIVYKDAGNSDYGTAVVGTVSGKTISFGTPVVYQSAATEYNAATFDSANGKVVVACKNQSASAGTAYVGTVSGTSISFGSSVEFEGGNTTWISATYDSANEKVVLSFVDEGDGSKGKARVGTVSGTSISFGSETTYNNGGTVYTSITYDSNAGKVVIAFRDQGNSNYGTGIVGTVSGTSISFGSETVFESARSDYIGIGFDSTANKVIVGYSDDANSSYVTAVVGTVSGTSVSFGTPVVVASSNSEWIKVTYNSASNTTFVSWMDITNSNYGSYALGTVSGTSISFTSSAFFASAHSSYQAAVYDPDQESVVIAYRDQGNSNYGTAIVYQDLTTNSNNFAGITNQAINNSASGEVVVEGGVITNASLGLTLTPGTTYYVQDDGSLNTATSTVNYDIASGSYTQAFSVSSQDTFPSGVAFNPAGTKMFVVGNTGDDVNEYTLSTGFDVSTASFVDSFSVSGQQAAPMSVAFNTDGTKMYIVGETEDTVAQYALSAGFDVSSASYTQAFDISGQETEAQGITFNTDGTKMFIVGDTGNDINEYTLSSGFDVSSASFVDSFSLASQTTQPKEGVFNSDGTELYVLARDNQKVYKYTLTTGFDVSSASYASVEFSVSSQESSPQGLAFSADGSKMYVCGDTGDDVNQYATTSTATNSTTVTAGKALAATTLLLKG